MSEKQPIERDVYAEAMLGQMLRAFFLAAHHWKFEDNQLDMDKRIQEFIRGMDQNGIRVERYSDGERLGCAARREADELRDLLRDALDRSSQISPHL